MANMRMLIRILFVIFIANKVVCFGGICDNCCNCFKDKNITANLLVNNNWYNSKNGKDFVLELFNKTSENEYENWNIKIKIKKENNKINGEFLVSSKNKLKTDLRKWALFEITTKEDEKVYLYCSDIGSIDNRGIFECKENYKSISVITCDTSEVTDMSYMFYGCNSLKELHLDKFNTEKVTDMSWMFSECSSLTEINLDKFNTEKVTDMSWMFSICSSLKELNLNFNTSNVTGMGYMFCECSGLTKINFGENFDTAKVNNMENMFNGCSGLTEIKFKKKFDTSNVTNMSCMFYGCSSLEKLNLDNFNTGSVTNMSYMFFNCSKLENINFGENFNTAKVNNTKCMFRGCNKFPGEIKKNLRNVKEIIDFFKKNN